MVSWCKMMSRIAAAAGFAAAVLVMLAFMSSAVDAQDKGLNLRQAASRGETAAVRRLLGEGAAVDAQDQQRQTPLLLAVSAGHTDAARALIEAGADINAQAGNRDTPWLLAGARGRTEILKLMIPRGPDLTIRNRYGGNALIPACERAHVETVRLLLAETKIDVNHVNDLGWTCLLEIVILGDGGTAHQDVARMVLDAGANPNFADKEGLSPAFHARQKGQVKIAELIERAGGR